jgi:hypothetical protein
MDRITLDATQLLGQKAVRLIRIRQRTVCRTSKPAGAPFGDHAIQGLKGGGWQMAQWSKKIPG